MPAEFDIMGGFVSPDVKKQFDELNKYAEQSAAKMKELAVQKDKLFGSVSGGDLENQKLITKLQKQSQLQEQNLKASNNKLLLLDKKFRDAMELQSINSTNKINKANNQKTGYINELKREVSELTAAYATLTNSELKSTGGQQALLNLKNKRAELAGLRAAYGDNTMYVGEYSRGVNGLKQSMTMLAGEMPNFAQSFRIGMMSLSNNWMGLSQAISIAKQEQKQYMEQFQAGLISKKPDSLFKMITKSIFSMNLVLMVAVTVMQLYNEEIGDFFEKVFKGTSYIDKMTISMKALMKVSEDYGGQAFSTISTIEKLGVQIRTYRAGIDDAKTIVDEFNTTFGTHLSTINQVKIAYGEMATEAIKSAMKMQAAMDFINQGSQQMLRKLGAENVLSTFKPNEVSTAEKELDAYLKMVENRLKLQGGTKEWITKIKNEIADEFKSGGFDNFFGGLSTGGENVIDAYKNTPEAKALKKYEDERGEALLKAVMDRRAANAAVNEAIKRADALYPGTKATKTPTGSGGSHDPKKQFTEINVLREYYKSEEEMMRRLADLENDITKENEDGVLNSYKKRENAAKLYYGTVEQLANQDRFVAVMNEKLKADAENRAIKQKYDNNVTKFGADSPEAIKSGGELEVGKATIAANLKDSLLKINDEYTKRILEASKKRSKDLLAIDKDLYSDEVYLLEQKEKRQLEFLAQDTTSVGEMGLGMVGVKKDNSLEKGKASRQLKKNTLLGKLDKGAKGQEEKDIWRELELLKQQDADADELKLLEAKEEAKASIVEDSIDILKSLWNGYYEFQKEEIDKQLDYQTKINDESIKQYEDEADAGKHSAKDVTDFKANMLVYQTSQEEEAAKKKKQLEKEQFLLSQAMALASVWINYASTLATLPKASSTIVSQAGVPGIPIALGYSSGTAAWVTGAAIAQSALIAAQTIPAFEQGGDVEKSGISLVGEKRHELIYDKKTGKSFITPSTPTLMHLDKGMHVYPDINKLDLDSFNLSQMPKPMIHEDDRLLDEVKRLNKTLSKQKTPTINGMRLMQQLQMNQKVIGNRRGLL